MDKNINLIECDDNGYGYIEQYGLPQDLATLAEIESNRNDMDTRQYFKSIYDLAKIVQFKMRG